MSSRDISAISRMSETDILVVYNLFCILRKLSIHDSAKEKHMLRTIYELTTRHYRDQRFARFYGG